LTPGFSYLIRLFVQAFQEFSEPRGIEEDYIDEKKRRQRQEEYGQIHRENSQADEDPIFHTHNNSFDDVKNPDRRSGLLLLLPFLLKKKRKKRKNARSNWGT
jgi:hypothetical protein